jgi:membrane protease YdiL (CAAX protease family)
MKNNREQISSFDHMSQASVGWRWPGLMSFIRLPLVLLGSAIAILAYQWSGEPVGLAAGLGWSTLTLTVVNLLCLGLLRWRARVEGWRIGDGIGFRWNRILPDFGWGFLWSLALGALLLLGIFLTLLFWYGGFSSETMQEAFTGSANFSFNLPSWLAVLSAVIWPVTNAPVEELQYRGYAQPALTQAWNNPSAGLLIPALGFGLQHIVFAVTLPSAIAYSIGFFLWGVGAGLIIRRQGRLFPLIVAHYISNLSFGVVPLFIILNR